MGNFLKKVFYVDGMDEQFLSTRTPLHDEKEAQNKMPQTASFYNPPLLKSILFSTESLRWFIGLYKNIALIAVIKQAS